MLPLPEEIATTPFCQEVSPFTEGVYVNYPEGVDNPESVLLRGLIEDEGERSLFTYPGAFEHDIPGGLGYQTEVEGVMLSRLRSLAASHIASPILRFDPEHQEQGSLYAFEARTALSAVSDLYKKHEDLNLSIGNGVQRLPLAIPESQIQFNNPLDAVGRVNDRNKIRELWHRATHLIWCMLYLGALKKARQQYDARPPEAVIDLPYAPPVEPGVPPAPGELAPRPQPLPPPPIDPGGSLAPPPPPPPTEQPYDPGVEPPPAPTQGEGCDPQLQPPTGFQCLDDGSGRYTLVLSEEPSKTRKKKGSALPWVLGGAAVVTAGFLLSK